MRALFSIVIVAIFCSFQKKHSDHELIRMLNSGNKDSIVLALDLIKDSKDSSLVKYIMQNPGDPRITHEAFHKGMSIYQLKMGAMKRITSIAPPKKISYEPDTSVINFYLGLCKKKGWLK